MSLESELSKPEIDAALAANSGKVGKAARDLGIHRRTLMRRMRVLGMAEGTPGRRYQKLHRRKHRRLGMALGGLVAATGLVFVASKMKGSGV